MNKLLREDGLFVAAEPRKAATFDLYSKEIWSCKGGNDYIFFADER